MKYFSLLLLTVLFSGNVAAQKKVKNGANFKLQNAIIIAQFDQQEDRYSIEAGTTQIFTAFNVKSQPSLNLVKIGENAANLATAEMLEKNKADGFDTYVIISVRGYDKKFKPSETTLSLEQALDRGSLFSIYQQDIVSVTFEFRVYRNGQYVGVDNIKCGGGSGRDAVMQKLRSKLEKRLSKYWK